MKDFWFFILIGVCTSVIFSSGQVENTDTHLRLTQARLLTEKFDFGLPDDTGEDFHGNIAINKVGDRQMVYNPGQTLLFYPVYSFCKVFFKSNPYYASTFIVSFFNFIIHALCSFFFYCILLKLGYKDKKSLLISMIFLFTSYSFSFAQSTYEHHYEMLFVLMSLYLVISSEQKSQILFAGFVIGTGVIFRSTTILAIPGLLFLLKSKKEFVYFLMGCLPGVVVILFYNYVRFDNPLETGYSLAWHLAHGNELSFWSINYIPEALAGFLVTPGKGLIFFSTTIFISIIGFKKFFLTHKRLSIAILITVFLYLLLYSMNFAWHGSIWAFGPRYILPILPLLYLFIIEVKLSKFILGLCCLGFVSQLLFMTVNYKRDVLEQHVQHKGIENNSYIFSASNIPQISQSRQLLIITPKNLRIELRDYQPNSTWKKEIRTGSSQQVLESSIEKNSINYWWIRIFHWKKPVLVLILSLTLVLIAMISLYFIIKTKLRTIEN